MSCLAMSCPIKSQHSCYSQGAATVLMTWCGGAPGKTQKQQHKHHDSGKAASPGYILFARPLTMPRMILFISFPRFHTASV